MLAWLTKPRMRTAPLRSANAGRKRQRALAVLEFDVLAAGAMEGVVEVVAVGYGGHEREGVACGEVAIGVLGDEGVGVAAGVGGVVPCAVVIDGPVEELEVGIGADGVEIEEVGEAHAAGPELKSAFGEAGSEGERGSRRVDHPIREADDLVEFVAGEVGFGAEAGIADDVQIGESGEAEGFGDAASPGGFDVEEAVGLVARLL